MLIYVSSAEVQRSEIYMYIVYIDVLCVETALSYRVLGCKYCVFGRSENYKKIFFEITSFLTKFDKN